MLLVKRLILSFVLPPTGPILFALVGFLILQLRPRLGRILIGASFLSLLLLSTPWLAGNLISSLQKFPPITDSQLISCEAIVVLGAGIYRNAPEYGEDTIGYVSLERLRYAIHLSKRSGLPILASGGTPEGGRSEAQLMRESAEKDFAKTIAWTEIESSNTSESARLTSRILKQHGIDRIALVSHAWHLPRAVALFEAADLDVVPAPTAFAHAQANAYAFLPGAGALAVSSRVLQEWLSILAVRWGIS